MIMHAGEILKRRGLLSDEQLQESRNSDASSVVQAAIALGYVLAALDGFPQKLIYRQSLFPIGFEDESIIVATSDPLDLYPLDEASAATDRNIIPVVAERAEIARLMNQHLGVGSETVEGLMAPRVTKKSSYWKRSKPTEVN